MVAGHYAASDAEPLMLMDLGQVLTQHGLVLSSSLTKFITREFGGQYALVAHPVVAGADRGFKLGDPRTMSVNPFRPGQRQP
jgi:hypothetical protein